MPDVYRVLVVDDEQPNLDTFRRAFRKDFEMVLASSGADALAHVRAQRFDIAIVDYSMPGMNGVEFLRQAAAIQPEMARLMVTAHDALPEVRESRESGLAISIVPKPWSRERILQCVETAQRIAEMRKSVERLGQAIKR